MSSICDHRNAECACLHPGWKFINTLQGGGWRISQSKKIGKKVWLRCKFTKTPPLKTLPDIMTEFVEPDPPQFPLPLEYNEFLPSGKAQCGARVPFRGTFAEYKKITDCELDEADFGKKWGCLAWMSGKNYILMESQCTRPAHTDNLCTSCLLHFHSPKKDKWDGFMWDPPPAGSGVSHSDRSIKVWDSCN